MLCLTDLDSTNGTFVNGHRLTPNQTVTVKAEDQVQIARMVFVAATG